MRGPIKIAVFLLLSSPLWSRSIVAVEAISLNPEDLPNPSRLNLDLPLLDAPFNWTGNTYSFPSMRQSLEITRDFYEGTHFLIMKGLHRESPFWSRVLISLFDIFTLAAPFPPSFVWLHEEWHRAVLSRRNISSYNGVYDFDIGKDGIPVRKVGDNDLVRLKREHPAEQVRLSSAGIESEYELNLAFEKEVFFNRGDFFPQPMLWANYLSSSFYMLICVNDVDKTANTEGTDIAQRDFTGYDCNGWVYDLHRPDEAYSARGTHPSGVGINRHRNFSDLSPKEQSFLKLQTGLSFLNLIDPFLFGWNEFSGINPFNGAPFLWNITLRHHLTSFGYSIEPNLFIKENDLKILFTIHNYINDRLYLPGFDLEFVRYPWRNFTVSGRAMAWLQPERQRFDADGIRPGGLLSARLGFALSRYFEPYLEAEGKTEGWVAGNVYLGKNFSFRLGLNLEL